MNILAVAAFVAIVLGMGAMHHFFPTFHSFPTLDASAVAVRADAALATAPRDGR
jgi:hypothetical protein